MSPGAPASHYQCHGCGAALAPDDPAPFRCPRGRDDAVADHVLERVLPLERASFPRDGDPQPFVRFRELLHAWRFARRAGVSDEDWCGRARALDDALAALDGKGFAFTPWLQAPELARELGVGELWFKDETAGVGGTHKARHLFGLALFLGVALTDHDPRLVIASCGNAALAAALVARAAGHSLEAFVPIDARADVLARLEELGARVVRCARGAGDPSGDPCQRALRAALDEGALPFTVQGPDCAQALEGGRTLAYELAAQHAGQPPLDALFVQVGGGALLSSVADGLADARALGLMAHRPAMHAVQTAACHPLERAWRRFATDVVDRAGADVPELETYGALARWMHDARAGAHVRHALGSAARNRARYMQPWPSAPRSVAQAILDDETYDWHAALRGMVATGGRPVVVDDEQLLRARDRARALAGVAVDASGAAGLAGAFELAGRGELHSDARLGVLFTGGAR